MNKKALLVIDLQNDYFPKGKFPLWNTDQALSNIKAAEKYSVSILMDCCTTVDEMIHKIALNAVSTRVPLMTTNQVL